MREALYNLSVIFKKKKSIPFGYLRLTKKFWFLIFELRYELYFYGNMSNSGSQRNAIGLICRRPDAIWLDFLSDFKQYDVFIITDDNTTDYRDSKSRHPAIHFVQIDAIECENQGFTNLNAVYFNKVTAWDKAVLYFADKNTAYDHIWLFEDDIFFYSEQTIKNIDLKFPQSDLLSAPYKVSTSSSKDWWWWPEIKVALEAPYYNAMVCGIRVSRKLLDKIRLYASKNNTLFFLEALFPTIALKNNLLYHTPKQFVQVYFRYNWTAFSKKNIFHPVKNLELHKKARKDLSRGSFRYKIRFHMRDIFTQSYTQTKEFAKSLLRSGKNA
jgi:hypothetical protein